jgi:WhiB family redox-sensing transcriptional regulator
MSKGGTRQRIASGTAASPIARNAEYWDWQLLARCRGADPSMFFHGDGERGFSRRRRERKAKQFCAQCPVVMQCLEHSLRFQEPYGIWGGIAECERHRILSSIDASEIQMSDLLRFSR